MSIGKKLAVGAATATIGLALGATVLAPVVAGAQESTTTVAPDGIAGAQRLDHIREALEGLVTDNTITSGQADAIAAHLAELAPGPRHHHRGRHLLIGLDIAADTIGIDLPLLIEGLREGQTIAEVAAAHGSSADAVIDALVGANQARLDELVADGSITAEEALTRAAEAAQRITALVNGDHEFPPFGGAHDADDPAVTEGA